MLLGISSYTYGWNIGVPDSMPLKVFTENDLIQRATEFDVNVLQVGDNLPLHQFDEERLQAFKSALQQRHIQLEVGARGLTDGHLERYITLAANMHARLLRFVIDDVRYQPSLSEIIQIIRSHVLQLEQHNITLGLENHDRLKAAAFAEIIRAVNSEHVGICLDTANSLGAGENIETIVEVLAPYTVNLHIKDFGIERLPHKMGFIIDGRIAGKGMLNIPELLQKINHYSRCRTAILEQWVPPDSDIQITSEKETDWAKQSMAYLQSIADWQ